MTALALAFVAAQLADVGTALALAGRFAELNPVGQALLEAGQALPAKLAIAAGVLAIAAIAERSRWRGWLAAGILLAGAALGAAGAASNLHAAGLLG